MAIRIKNNKFSPKQVPKLHNTYFKPVTLNTKRTKSRGNYKIQKFSSLLSYIILPATLTLSIFSLLLVFLPGLFNIKTTVKAAPNKDSVRIITNYTYTTKPFLQKVEK
jgi:amino acid transporter